MGDHVSITVHVPEAGISFPLAQEPPARCTPAPTVVMAEGTAGAVPLFVTLMVNRPVVPRITVPKELEENLTGPATLTVRLTFVRTALGGCTPLDAMTFTRMYLPA